LSLAALLLLAVVATRGRSAVPRGNGLVLRGPDAAGRTVVATPAFGGGHANTMLTAGLTGVIAVVLLAYLVAMVALIAALTTLRLRKARKAPHRRAGMADDETEGLAAVSAGVLLRGARAALLELRRRTGGPPSDAVIAAWLGLEESAAEGGTERRPEQTATEFTADVLAAHDVDPAALATLRALYQRARFGEPDTVTERDVDAAVTALDRIADTLTVRARAESGPVTTP
jgi:hypothetical protein